MTEPVNPGPVLDEDRYQAEIDLPLRSESAAQARRYIADVLRTWRCDEDLIADVLLVTSELVTNAVRHGGRRCALRLVSTVQLLRVEVSDGSSVLPEQRQDDSDEGGRGLAIIDAVAGRWGVAESDAGKTVWAQWPMDSAPAPEQRAASGA